jgi:hypothetical protein
MRTRLIAAAAALMLAACANIPNAQLSEYRAAFGQANEAKDAVLVDFDAALTEARAFVRDNEDATPAGAASPFPAALKGPGTSVGPDATEARRAAWRVVERYNAALGDLAEGKSDAAVKAAVGAFGTSVGKFIQAATGSVIPGFDAAVGVAQTVFEALEKERRTKEFKRAVRAGRPLVEQILDALYDDAEEQYTLRLGLGQHAFVAQMSALTTSIGGLYGLVESYKAPAVDGGELAGVNERLNAATLPLATQLQEYPFAVAWAAAGGAPLTPAVQSTVDLSLVAIEQRAAAMVALIHEVHGVRDILRAYQTLLVKTKDALVKLNQALDAPVDLESEANEIMETVFKIKQGIEKYRVAREKASAAKPPAASPATPATP